MSGILPREAPCRDPAVYRTRIAVIGLGQPREQALEPILLVATYVDQGRAAGQGLADSVDQVAHSGCSGPRDGRPALSPSGY